MIADRATLSSDSMVVVAESLDLLGGGGAPAQVSWGHETTVITVDDYGWWEFLTAIRPRSVLVAIGRCNAVEAILRIVQEVPDVHLWFPVSGTVPDREGLNILFEELGMAHGQACCVNGTDFGVGPGLVLSLVSDSSHYRASQALSSLGVLLRARQGRGPSHGLWVGCVGPTPPFWFGKDKIVVQMEKERDNNRWDELWRRIEVIVVEERNGWSQADMDLLLSEAQRHDAVVVALRRHAGDSWPCAQAPNVIVGNVDDRGISVAMAPPVDTTEVNPRGFNSTASHGTFAAVVSGGQEAVWGRVVDEAVADRGIETIGLVGPVVHHADHESSGHSRRLEYLEALPFLRRSIGAVDDPRLHDSDINHAGTLVWLAAAGIPTACHRLPRRVAHLIGKELSAIMEGVLPHDLREPDFRERVSVATRRIALRDHSVENAWRQLFHRGGLPYTPRPTVSVLMPTKRPEQLEHAVSQIAAQAYDQLEVVVLLHGSQFSEADRKWVLNRLGRRCHVSLAPDEWLLGDVLNYGVQVSSGDLIAKMDDDDWYGENHIMDLVLADEYSGAGVVGKGAEFVYLSDSDTTVRRSMGGAEVPTHNLAGGTLLVSRAVLRELGGWRRLRLGEDRALIEDVKELGLPTYRTHGYEYVLNRGGDAHAWAVESEYFIEQADVVMDGLRLPWAMGWI